MAFKTSISPKDKPTIETFHSLVTSVLPPGIYQGGLVTPGGARSISVSPFVCRAPQGGFTVISDTTETIAIPTVTSPKTYLLCVKCKPWVSGSVFDDHQVSLEMVEGQQNVVTTRWEPIPGYADAAYVLIFAKVQVTTIALQPQLLANDIDTSVASTIDFQYQSGRVALSGSSSYNGQQGAVVTHNLGTTNYRVAITTTDLIPDAIGLGDVWVVKSSNFFTVYATSYIQNLTFDWYLTTSPDVLATPTGSGAYGTAIPQGPPGTAGIQGLPGTPGTAGIPGSVILNGSITVAPSNVYGFDGDYYFNYVTYDLYTKLAGSWGAPIANLKGAEGGTPPKALTVSTNPPSGLPSDGDEWVVYQ